MDKKDEEIQKTMDRVKDQIPEGKEEEVKQLAETIYKDGATPKEAIGLSDDMVEGIYSYAYRMYNTGTYEQAIQMFRLLIMLNPTEEKFIMGLAACFHMQNEYEVAASTYLLGSMVSPLNPVFHYHAADCYIQLDQLDLAKRSLESCIRRCSPAKKYGALKDRAEASLEAIKGGKPVEPMEKETEKKKPVNKPSS